MSAASQLDDILQRVERQMDIGASDALKELAENSLRACVETWPGTDRAATHPYARDRSKQTWRIQYEGTFIAHIINTSDYSGHVEDGATRKGEKTAGPWKARGSQPYALTATVRTIREDIVTGKVKVLRG